MTGRITPVRPGRAHLGDAPRRRGGCLPLLLAVTVLLALGVGYGYYVYQAAQPRLAAGVERLQYAQAILDQRTVLPRDLDAAQTGFTEAAAAFQAAREQAGPLPALAPALGWLPGVGGDLGQAPDLLTLGTTLADLGVALTNGLRPAAGALQAAGPGPAAIPPGENLATTLAPVLAALQADPAALDRARTALLAAQAARARLAADRLATPELRAALDQLDILLPQLAQALDGISGLPPALDVLLGRRAAGAFLVVLQDPDEIRATGGVIRAVGVLRVEQARFTLLSFRDSAAFGSPGPPGPAEPAAPADFVPYLAGRGWTLGEANWAPDFPSSARTLEALYQAEGGTAVDGTVALDPQLVQGLLEVTGPVTPMGSGTAVGADNVHALLGQYFMPDQDGGGGAGGVARQDFLPALFAALVDRLQHLPGTQLGALVAALRQGLDEKHLLVSVQDAATARWLAARPWDGALTAPPGDLVALVDSNMGLNRIGNAITRRLTYTLTLSAGPAQPHQATLTVRYLNRSQHAGGPCVPEARPTVRQSPLVEGCYWNHVRVYVPAGSTLQRARWGPAVLAMQTRADGNLTAFAALLTLAPGEERELTLDYTIPYAATGGGAPHQYTLTVRKQPGADRPLPLLALAIRLPPGATLRTAHPALPPGSPPGEWVRLDSTPFDLDRTLILRW